MRIEESYGYSPQAVIQVLAGGLAMKQICQDTDHFIFVINSVDIRLVGDGENSTKCIFAIDDSTEPVDDKEVIRMLQEADNAVCAILAERMVLCGE